jgi:hypothetical protein
VDRDLAASYADALDAVLRRAHLMRPDSLDELAAQGAARLGATEARLWLIDYEQTGLVPVHDTTVPRRRARPRPSLVR